MPCWFSNVALALYILIAIQHLRTHPVLLCTVMNWHPHSISIFLFYFFDSSGWRYWLLSPKVAPMWSNGWHHTSATFIFICSLWFGLQYVNSCSVTLTFHRSLCQPAILPWTWKPFIMNGFGGERSVSFFSLNTDCIINKSDWSLEPQTHNSLSIHGRTLLACCTIQTQTENYTVKHSHAHTFDNHKRFQACGYLINMTGFMDFSVQRKEWWEDDRRGSPAPGTPGVYNTHIREFRSPPGLCGCVTYTCSGRLLFI